MLAMGPLEILILLVTSAGGQPTDLASLLAPADYFNARSIEVSFDKLTELAAKDPADGAAQMAQLLALRMLGEDAAKFKKSAGYAAQRKVIEDIAAGKKAQDKLGFAKEYAQRALALLDGGKAPLPPSVVGTREEALSWFPAGVTFVGSLGYQPTGSPAAPKAFASELLKKMPVEAKAELYKVVDMVGNVRVERIAFAFQDDGMNKGRNFARFTGKANHAWLRDAFKKLDMEPTERKDAQGIAITTFAREGRGPVFALVGDRDLVIAGHANAGEQDAEVLGLVLKVRDKKMPHAAAGPMKATLDKIPAKALGFFAGEFPDEFRREMVRTFGAFPKKVVAHLERSPTGMELSLHGTLDGAEDAKTFVQNASKLRKDGLDALQKLPEGAAPGINLGELRNTLNSLQLEAAGSSISLRMLVSDDALRAIPALFWVSELK